MIVDEPPYDLVALFADEDARLLIQGAIHRGEARGCLSPFRWRSLRDARRDAFRADPTKVLGPFLNLPECRFLLAWDHEGSGSTADRPAEAEEAVICSLLQAGVARNRVVAVAFEPEVETLLAPVWERVKTVMAAKRGMQAPSDDAVLALIRRVSRSGESAKPSQGVEEALLKRPKEMFSALVRFLNLRRSPRLYSDLGAQLSLRGLKEKREGSQISDALVRWFPGKKRGVNGGNSHRL